MLGHNDQAWPIPGARLTWCSSGRSHDEHIGQFSLFHQIDSLFDLGQELANFVEREARQNVVAELRGDRTKISMCHDCPQDRLSVKYNDAKGRLIPGKSGQALLKH
jgi:hypothetical protein